MQHHPDISFSYNMVEFKTQTHRIIDPSISSAEAEGKKTQIPASLTPNDARLAIRVEKLFSDVYLADGRGRTLGTAGGTAPATLEEIQQMAKSKDG